MTTGATMEPNRVEQEDGSQRGRRIAAAVLTVLACIGMVASTIGLWAGRTVFDSPTFARTVADAATDPAVADALGTYLADEAVDLVWELGEGDALGTVDDGGRRPERGRRVVDQLRHRGDADAR